MKLKRDKAMRRTIKHTLGSRVARRSNTKSTNRKTERTARAAARVSEIEKFVNWPPEGEAVTIQ